jgi:hypothetical protein
MKGPKGWDYLNEYKQAADGQYVYTGNLYVLHDSGNVRKKIGVLWALSVAAVIGSGLINAGGMNNSFYVIIPYIIEVICAFALSWHVIRLIFTKGDFKEYEFLPESIFEEMRLTQYMRNELKDLEHYCAAAGREEELLELIEKMRREDRLPAKDKKAGREVLDEIYSYLR